MATPSPFTAVTLQQSDGTPVEALASEDPTQSQTNRRRFKQRFHSRWRTVRGDVRTLIQSDRHYQPGARRATPSEQLADFREWLDATLDEAIIETRPQRAVRRGRHWATPFVRDLYTHGIRQADRALRRAGWEFDAPSPEAAVRYPPHNDQLRQEYLAVYQDIEDAAHAAEKEATRAYRQSIREGRTPTATISAVNDRLDKVGRYRTDLVAETEAIQIINDAALTRYESVGVEAIGVAIETIPETDPGSEADADTDTDADTLAHTCTEATVESLQPTGDDVRSIWQTQGDHRVCPECASLSGTVFEVEAMRTGAAPTPPIHPNCRCFVTPLNPAERW
jgi:hypothetical protein